MRISSRLQTSGAAVAGKEVSVRSRRSRRQGRRAFLRLRAARGLYLSRTRQGSMPRIDTRLRCLEARERNKSQQRDQNAVWRTERSEKRVENEGQRNHKRNLFFERKKKHVAKTYGDNNIEDAPHRTKYARRRCKRGFIQFSIGCVGRHVSAKNTKLGVDINSLLASARTRSVCRTGRFRRAVEHQL